MSTSPKQLGKYELQERLGHGGMAEVWKAFDPQLKRYVAIKFLHTSLRSDPDFVNRFVREGQAIASLRHPNIVQVYDFQVTTDDKEDPMAYMVMDYIEGSTLAEYIRNTSYVKKFPSNTEIVRLFTSICVAVDYAHEHQIIHRDIKPANILLDSRNKQRNPMGEPVLTDFGIVKIMGAETMTATGISLGTPYYISPEQVQGKQGNERSDIYALGVMLYEVATGEQPYQGDTPYSIMVQRLHSAPRPASLVNPQMPPELDDVIFRALARNPDARFASAAALAAALARALRVPVPEQVSHADDSADPANQPTYFKPLDRPSDPGLAADRPSNPGYAPNRPSNPGFAPNTPSNPGIVNPGYAPNRPSNPGFAPNTPSNPGFAENAGYAPNRPSNPGFAPNTPSNPGFAENAGYAPNRPSNPGFVAEGTANMGYSPNRPSNPGFAPNTPSNPGIVNPGYAPNRPSNPGVVAGEALDDLETLRAAEAAPTTPGAAYVPQSAGAALASTPAPPPSRPVRNPRRRLLTIGTIVLVLLVLAGAGLYALPRLGIGGATNLVGTASFFSTSQPGSGGMPSINDGIEVRLQNVPAPGAGNRYYAWLRDSQTETASIYLGPLTLNQGVATLSYTDSRHRDLLEGMDNFLVTEESASVVPNTPTINKVQWRYYAQIPQTKSPKDHFSYLDHLRHLLSSEPDLEKLGLHGGVDFWFLYNIQEMQKQAMEVRDHASVPFVRQQVTNILYYLDGPCAVQDLSGAPVQTGPENAGIAHDTKVPLLPCALIQTPPDHLTHIGLHLTGIAQAPGATQVEVNRAIQINNDLNVMKSWLAQMRSDARKLALMDDTQLGQAQALRSDLVINANYVIGGRLDPSTQTLEPSAQQICDNIELLANFEVTPFK